MTKDDELFLERLLATFKVEAQEHLSTMSSLLLELERPAPASQTAQRVEQLFREAHSLKGAARSVNLADIERVCRPLEQVLSALKRKELQLSPPFFDTLSRTLDGLAQLLARDVDGSAAPVTASAASLVRALEDLLASPGESIDVAQSEVESATPPVALAESAGADTVRIATAKLEALMVQAEDLQAFKFSAEHLVEEQRSLSSTLAEWKRQWDKSARNARVVQRALAKQSGLGAEQANANGRDKRVLAQLLDAFERDEIFIKSLGDRFAQLERVTAQERRALSGIVDKLLDEMKQALMLPIATLFQMVPKLARDLARDGGKEVDVAISGATLEIDRRILEQMKTPLIHLVRNAIDHGIEPPERRVRDGKRSRGRIAIDVTPREGNKVEIVLADDGAGIALDKLQAKAQQMGLAATATLDLVFESGLSTSPLLTDLSGHGLGLAIVREKVERLGGNVGVDSQPGLGTRFTIVLPATLATFRGLVVGIGDRQFVLPSRSVERVARVKASAVQTVENRETVALDTQVLSLAHLATVLELDVTSPRRSDGLLLLVVLANAGKRIAFVVDEVLGDQEVLVKPLGPPLQRVRNVAGATVLGPGHVVPLLNVADLLKSAIHASATRTASTPSVRHEPVQARSVLVVEDSITSRALLKGILESAGYEVSTAVDGIDALTRLHARHFDLVVSDVEMPHLDGFDLTARLRADKRLADLPVVLVTALGSREDKERGVQVGANAYVVKSSFDQDNLLDVVRGLL